MASNDNIFGRKGGNIKAAFSADSVSLQVGDIGGDGHDLIVQNLRVQYAQQVSKIYDLSSQPDTGADAYYVAGRAEGQASLQKVIGPTADLQAFYKAYGDPCEVAGEEGTEKNIVLTGKFGCTAGGGITGEETAITLVQPIVVSFGMSVNANDVLITEDTAMIFHSMHFGT